MPVGFRIPWELVRRLLGPWRQPESPSFQAPGFWLLASVAPECRSQPTALPALSKGMCAGSLTGGFPLVLNASDKPNSMSEMQLWERSHPSYV